MNRLVFPVAMLVTLILTALFGCSGPADPVSNPLSNHPSSSTDVPAFDSSRMLWGIWRVTIDPETLEVEVMPVRGAQFTCNVTRFLQPPSSPVHMLSFTILAGSIPSTGYFEVNVGLRHPFPSLPFYCGFDVRGILIANATLHALGDPGLVYASPSETHILNADGWTRWWNPTEFTSFETIFGYAKGKLAPPVFPTATLNGYKYFADGFDSDSDLSDLDPATRGTFSVTGGVNSRLYKIQFGQPGGSTDFNFNYAIDASWDPPDPAYAPAYPIEAFPLEANCQEAYWIDADFTGSTAWFVDPSQKGGDLHVALEIGDWGALAAGTTVEDEIAAIRVEGPSLLDTPIDVLPSAVVSDGNGVSSSVFTFDLLGVHPTGLTAQTILVTVESSHPITYEPQVSGGSNFDYPDAALAAHRFFDAPILDSPVGETPIITKIDPSNAPLDSGDVAVVITGENFASNATSKLVKSDEPAVEIPGTGIVVAPDGTTIDCSFDTDSADGAKIGLYDVVVTNPGPPELSGQLDEGFEIYQQSACSEVFSDEIYVGDLEGHAQEVHSIAFTADGLLVSRAYVGGQYGLYGYDVTQNGNVAGTPIVPNMLYGGNSIGDINVDDLTGNIVYCPIGNGWAEQNNIVAYTPTGELIGQFKAQNIDQIQGMDTDDDGSIWVIGFSYKQPPGDPPQIDEFYIDHYTWDSTGQKYDCDPVGSIPAEEMSNPWAGIYDVAISYSDHRFMIFSIGALYGRIDCYDLSSGVPDYLYGKENILPYQTGAHGFYMWIAAGQIEIDHSSLTNEECRVLVAARQIWWNGETFVKLDTDANILDTWNNPDADAEDRYFWGTGINPNASDPDGTFAVAMEDYSAYGGDPSRFHVFEVPPGW